MLRFWGRVEVGNWILVWKDHEAAGRRASEGVLHLDKQYR